MNRRIVFFNVIFYGITFWLIFLGKQDPSASLGYAFYLIGFWVIMTIILILLWVKRRIIADNIFDKIGIFAATPIISIVVFISITYSAYKVTEQHFDRDSHRYMVRTFYFDKSGEVAKIEFYRSAELLDSRRTISYTWLKDSTWLYFSEAGDTINKIKY